VDGEHRQANVQVGVGKVDQAAAAAAAATAVGPVVVYDVLSSEEKREMCSAVDTVSHLHATTRHAVNAYTAAGMDAGYMHVGCQLPL
jgi:hypothetical protein